MALPPSLTIGQRAADFAAARIGSWSFLISFNAFVLAWCAANHILRGHAFDPFPYILLNLVFSWVAGVQAPLIMISQNRQEEIARQQVRHLITVQEAIRDHLLASNGVAHSASGEMLETLNAQIAKLLTLLEGRAHADLNA